MRDLAVFLTWVGIIFGFGIYGVSSGSSQVCSLSRLLLACGVVTTVNLLQQKEGKQYMLTEN